jgi:hypothetical protein
MTAAAMACSCGRLLPVTIMKKELTVLSDEIRIDRMSSPFRLSAAAAMVITSGSDVSSFRGTSSSGTSYPISNLASTFIPSNCRQ